MKSINANIIRVLLQTFYSMQMSQNDKFTQVHIPNWAEHGGSIAAN